MLDIVFCNVPYVHLDHIYGAPAILKGVVQNHGYQAKTVDFGVELFKICNRDLQRFYQVQSWFTSHSLSHDTPEEIQQLFDHAIEWFQANPSKWIGISVMSLQSHRACLMLIEAIQKSRISSKIVIGGRGVQARCWQEKTLHRNALDAGMNYGFLIKKYYHIDQVIEGDGEQQIIDLLSENCDSRPVPVASLESYSIPDYSDYDIECYQFDNKETIWPIVGSKGCVRSCDFCDVGKLFGRYRYREPQDVVNEMIYLNRSIGARRFGFTDSLVNGGLKPFKEFLELLAQHNQQNPNNTISWQGNYICRPSSQVPKEIYALMQMAGADHLVIGAESGSDDVLAAMNKKTSVQSLFDELSQFRKHGITCQLLLTVGHWSETHRDFLQHLDMLIDLVPYVRSQTVTSVRIGFPMTIIPGTPSHENMQKNRIEGAGMVYFCHNNPNNTISEKVYRQLTILKLGQRLGIIDGSFVIGDLTYSLNAVMSSGYINEFYDKFFSAI